MNFSRECESPVDKWDCDGLQVDTRARDNTEKHLERGAHFLRNNVESDDEANYLYEKETAAFERPQASPQSPSSTTVLNRGTSSVKATDVVAGLPPEPKFRKIGGVRRRHFWIGFGIALAMVIAAAVAGGVIGATRHSSSSTLSNPKAKHAPSNDTNGNSPVQLPDVVIGSPISVVSYEENDVSQTFRLYYQTVRGNVKEAVSNGLAFWQAATPIFTDAMNNTGLAAVTYLNNSVQQGSIFYVGGGGNKTNLQEKRKIFNSSGNWEPGGLSILDNPFPTSFGNEQLSDNEHKNGWDRYRMAAVHSDKFHPGPGVRLFYHSGQIANQSFWVQELIWDQKSDNWTMGARFPDAFPNSHLAATIDASTNILRLFYSAGNGTLQERTLNITDLKTGYVGGLNNKNFLAHDSADIAAVSHNGTTYLYHYQNSSSPTIYEDYVSDSRSADRQESLNRTNTPVIRPPLKTSEGVSQYQPLAAAITNVTSLIPQIYVFWAGRPTGPLNATGVVPDVLSGYAELSEISRTINSTWSKKPASQVSISLGDDGAQPII